ncbi:MAG: efflux RND transporter periplasmic adaptor subunit [Akkermansiaceae bacterium]
MKKVIITMLSCLGILALTAGVIFVLKSFAPEAEKKKEVKVIPIVEVKVAQEASAEISLTSEGLVSARRETVINAEVPGRIIFVDPRFEVGGEFQAGEVILRLDEVNFRAAVAQAESTLADAELGLEQEAARGEQARRDWGKIGGGQKPSEMVLRIPFLKSAKARVASALAALEKAREDLSRTKVRAPFDCRVREATLDLGATVMAGTRIGQVYDVSGFEVRLPFSLNDYPLVPEEAVISLTDGKYSWLSQVVRREGDLERATLSAYIIAAVIPNEENPAEFWNPLPGMFVKATVGKIQLPGVIAVPRAAVRGRDRVAVMNAEGQLEFRTLTIVRSTGDHFYVSDGIMPGERIILTRLELPVEGMKVQQAKPKE